MISTSASINTAQSLLVSLSTTLAHISEASGDLTFSYDEAPQMVKAARPLKTDTLTKALKLMRQFDDHRQEMRRTLQSFPKTKNSEKILASIRSELKELEDGYSEAYDLVMKTALNGIPKEIKNYTQVVVTEMQKLAPKAKFIANPWVWFGDDDKLYYGSAITFYSFQASSDYTVGIIGEVTENGYLDSYVTGDRGKPTLLSMDYSRADSFDNASALRRRLQYHLDLDGIVRTVAQPMPLTSKEAETMKQLGDHVTKIALEDRALLITVKRKRDQDRNNIIKLMAGIAGANIRANNLVHIEEEAKGGSTVYRVVLTKKLSSKDKVLPRLLEVRDMLDLDPKQFESLTRWVRKN